LTIACLWTIATRANSVFKLGRLMNEAERMNLRLVAALDQYYARLADVARLSRQDRRLWYAAEEARIVKGLLPHGTAEIRAEAGRTARQIMADGLRQARRGRGY
jgi:hypothetical protein